MIKIVTFNMNPKFTEVTLNSTIPARKFEMIDITHEVSFCLLHYDFGSEI